MKRWPEKRPAHAIWRHVAWGAASGAAAAAVWGFAEGTAYLAIEVKLKGIYVSQLMDLWGVLARLADTRVVGVAVLLYGSLGALAGAGAGLLAGILAARRARPAPPPSTLMPALGVSLVLAAACEWVLLKRGWGSWLLGLALVPFFLGLAGAGERALRALAPRPWARTARRAAAVAGIGLVAAALVLSLVPGPRGERSGTVPAPSAARPAAGARPPHVVLIVLDTARADRFSAYGARRSTTPRIDALARDAVLFENAFTVAPWTLPAHASLFTGLYPSEHGCRWGRQSLAEGIRTLAEALSGAGYRTACFTANPWIAPFTGLARGFDEVFPIWRGATGSIERLAAVRGLRRTAGRYADEGAARTNRLLDRWLGPALEGGAPLFVFLNFMELHDPNWPAPEARRWLDPGVTRRRLGALNLNPYKLLAGVVRMGPEDFALLADLYDAQLTYLDRLVGELIDGLRARGILDDTLLVLTGDHGENLGDHGLLSHIFSLADSILRVPLVVRYPPRFPAGSRIEETAEIVDVTPTVAEIAGLRPESFGRPLSGRSLAALAARAAPDGGRDEGPRGDPRTTFAEDGRPRPIIEILRLVNPAVNARRFDRGIRSARQGNWKYVQWTDGEESLYDLAADPGEERDVAADRPEVAEGLARRLASRLGPPGEDEGMPPGEVPDLEARERLKSLGYLK